MSRNNVRAVVVAALVITFGPLAVSASPTAEPRASAGRGAGKEAKASASSAKASASSAKASASTSSAKATKADASASIADPAALRAVMRAKGNFVLSVELCANKQTCSPELLQSSETAFVTMCEKCAPAAECDEERRLIREGTAKRKHNPCR